MAPPASSTRRPRCGLLTTAAVAMAAAAAAVLVGAPARTDAAPPPRSAASLPAVSRLRRWSCPPTRSWHAAGGDSYEPPTTVRLPAAAVTDRDWNGLGGDSWWRIHARGVGYDVLQYTPLNYAKSTLPPGAAITYRFTAPASGRYRWAMKAAAPHPTDWNDVFVRWVGTAGSVWGRQKRAAGAAWSGLPSGEWQKIYTNVGKGEWAWGGFTKDHDPHMLITGDLAAGTVYEFQMTGRSHQVQVAAFGLMRCDVDGNGSPGCANVKDLDATPAAVCK